jgi:hypothetical protein
LQSQLVWYVLPRSVSQILLLPGRMAGVAASAGSTAAAWAGFTAVDLVGFTADLLDFMEVDSAESHSTMVGSTTTDSAIVGFSSAEPSHTPGGAIIRTMDITIIASTTLRRPGTIAPILPAIILM